MSIRPALGDRAAGGLRPPHSVSMQRCLSPEDMVEDLRQEAREGLTAPAKSIPWQWFYDKRGSELFEEISRLPDY